MSVLTVEGIVENRQIHLRGNVTLPEHTKVYVVVPDATNAAQTRIYSPRLAHPEQATDFTKQVIEVPSNAKL